MARRLRLLTLALVLTPVFGCKGVDTRVHWYFERMIEQESYRAYEASPLFPDRRAMRVPPGGTIPRGVVIETAVITEGIAEGPEILPSPGEIPDDFPMPLTGEFLELGRKHYEITCAVCHGLAGNAASTVATKMTLRPPPSLHLTEIRGFTPGELFRVVTEGYGLMPAYVSLLDWEERWAVVAYVKALQLSRSTEVEALPEPVRTEVYHELRRRPE